MNRPIALRHDQKPMLALLFCITNMGALLTTGALQWIGLPSWVGGVAAMGALFGTLLIFWRSGALRARFLVLLVAAFATAALAGWLLSRA